MVQKPPYGSPCNGCGLCCEDQLCPLGSHVFKRRGGPCPALMRGEDGASTCGLVVSPRKFAPVRTAVRGVEAMRDGALVLIGAGHGCDGLMDDETASPERREGLRREAAKVSDVRVFSARTSWGV